MQDKRRSRYGKFKIVPYKGTHAIFRDGSYAPLEIDKRAKLKLLILVHMAKDEYGNQSFY